MSNSLPIPLKAMTDCGAILGRRGAGKSGTGRVLLEHELLLGHRCCAIDPKGDYWGIRMMKDGSRSPFDIPVFGGQRADVPIEDDQGTELGQMVAQHNISTVIDLSSFSTAGMRRFMTAFAESLFRHNRQPLTLFVDEADQLAPQRVAAEQAHLLHHMESLIRQGRQRGIFMWMLTQRPAVINKNLLSQAETLIAMKMTTVHDRQAIRDWMEAHDPEQAKHVMETLAKLNVGEAWAWVPGADFLERVQFPLFETFDSGRTPQHGDPVNDIDLPPIEIGALAAALGKGIVEDPRDEELRALRSAVADMRERERDMRAEAKRLVDERDTTLETLIDLQDRIGMAIGSPRIHAAPADIDPADILMVRGSDGEVRPVYRDSAVVERIKDGRRGMRAVLAPVKDAKVQRGRG